MYEIVACTGTSIGSVRDGGLIDNQIGSVQVFGCVDNSIGSGQDGVMCS